MANKDFAGSRDTQGKSEIREELYRWFRSQGVVEAGAAKAIRLLDVTALEVEPRPSKWNRRGQFGIEERCRYF